MPKDLETKTKCKEMQKQGDKQNYLNRSKFVYVINILIIYYVFYTFNNTWVTLSGNLCKYMQLGITDLLEAGESVTIRPIESWQYVCYEGIISEIPLSFMKFLG